MHGPLHHRTPKLLTHWPASLSCPAWIGLVSGRCPLGNKEKKSSQPLQHNAPTPTLLATPLSPISVFSFHTAHRMDLPQAPQSLHTKTRRRAPLRYLFPPILASGVAMIVSQPSGPSNAQPCCCCGWCPVAGLTSVDKSRPAINSHSPPPPAVYLCATVRLDRGCWSPHLWALGSFHTGDQVNRAMSGRPFRHSSFFFAQSNPRNQSINSLAPAPQQVSVRHRQDSTQQCIVRLHSASAFPPSRTGTSFQWHASIGIWLAVQCSASKKTSTSSPHRCHPSLTNHHHLSPHPFLLPFFAFFIPFSYLHFTATRIS